METVAKQFQPKKKRDTRIQQVLYSRCLLTRSISLMITTIGKNLRETIEENIKFNFEGKCVVEGYIKPNSVKIITHSSGTIKRGNFIVFEVVFECDVCFPVEGMIIPCIVKNVTKAGVRAESKEVPSPIVVFVAKDHHFSMAAFNEIKVGDEIKIKVIGQRFELNDKYIGIIGSYVKEKDISQYKQHAKPRIEFLG